MAEDQHRAAALLIHGVGDAPSENTRSELKKALKRRLPGSETEIVWFDWNESVGPLVKHPNSIRRVGNSCVTVARLETGGQMERLLNAVYSVSLVVFYFFVVWTAVAHIASALHSSAPLPLRATLTMSEIVFPALPNSWMAASKIFAVSSLKAISLILFAIYPLMVSAVVLLLGQGSMRLAIRRVVLELFWPLLALTTMPSLLLGFIAIFIFFVGFISFVQIFPAYQIVVPVDTTAWWQATQETIRFGESKWRTFLVLATLIFVGSTLLALLGKITRPIWKVLNDIFRYLGDDEYRQRIHTHLEDTLSDLGDGEMIVIAHSLGSVIALDSLLSSPDMWSKFSRVRLVTCGSPLERLFHGWFPKTYSASDQYAAVLREQYAGFDWVNIFRPYDYIGASLGRSKMGIRNIDTQQCMRFHTGYWTDPLVIKLVLSTLLSSTSINVDTATSYKNLHAPLNRLGRVDVPDQEMSWGEVLWKLAIGAGLVGVVFTQFVLGPEFEKNAYANWISLVSDEGPLVDGRVCPATQITEEFSRDEFNRVERRIVTLKYNTNDLQTFQSDSARRDHPHVDWDKLQTQVYGSSPISRWRQWIGSSDPPVGTDIKCQVVKVQYSVLQPAVFVLPKYQQIPPYGSTVGGILTRLVRCIVMGIAWTIWCTLMFVAISFLVPTGRKIGVRSRRHR